MWVAMRSLRRQWTNAYPSSSHSLSDCAHVMVACAPFDESLTFVASGAVTAYHFVGCFSVLFAEESPLSFGVFDASVELLSHCYPALMVFRPIRIVMTRM